MNLLLDVNANLEAEDKEYGRTPLSWAADNGHTEVVKLLLDVNANFEAEDKIWADATQLGGTERAHQGGPVAMARRRGKKPSARMPGARLGCPGAQRGCPGLGEEAGGSAMRVGGVARRVMLCRGWLVTRGYHVVPRMVVPRMISATRVFGVTRVDVDLMDGCMRLDNGG